ncbi:hypothetical protein PCC7424_4353 [Gloeothece citriformis PCC 7424]|uniref:Uncharacterized protein n=1 Tax=Gloeothece citriformis (strain PCC 7424) TaxID=65393 RepID=B7K720_GLOC7|nr:hypothetical protein [Gloeothece citriformis]ACK72719.1 hypothetical protein PCC7424_4353 [Gloeothece citriformis PCC 7424]
MKKVNQYEQEFLEMLLDNEGFYPWNPADPEAEQYFTEQEEKYSLADSLNFERILKIDHTLFCHKNQ